MQQLSPLWLVLGWYVCELQLLLSALLLVQGPRQPWALDQCACELPSMPSLPVPMPPLSPAEPPPRAAAAVSALAVAAAPVHALLVPVSAPMPTPAGCFASLC